MKLIFTALVTLFSVSTFAKDGRFIVIFHPSIRADSVLLDTQTGRIWKDTCYKQNEEGHCTISAFTEQPIIGISTSEKDFKKYIENSEKK
ncbi:hypothetical protein ACJVC5_10875 [Peredibacter sp. HCB2-198]|uniref:hypothetical protein n=1 Tax=Peredibacter sp. HCB2-198 TaxID=3383025 RepID=UPI0038B60673